MLRPRKLKFKTFRQAIAYLSLFGLGLTLGAGTLAYLLAGEIYEYEDTVNLDHLPQVDAIVCLGGGRGRIAAAGDLWNRYWEASHTAQSSVTHVPVLYFSGMGRLVNWGLLGKQIKKGIAQKIRPEEVVIEKESSNTDANARWLVKFVTDRHWKKILLLTSSYHMKRARFIFEQTLSTRPNASKSPVEIETVSVYQEPFAAKEWRSGPNGIRVTVMEYLKWVYYRALWRAL